MPPWPAHLLPRSLRSSYEDLDTEVYQAGEGLAKVATPAEGHAEIAALNYRQITCVSDAATTFVNRPGVTIPEGSYGYLNGPALGIVSQEYAQLSIGSVEE
jgi:hypothetical protein